MNTLAILIAAAVATAPTGPKPATKAPPAEDPRAVVSAGRGPQLRVVKLDQTKAKAVYKVNAAPGLATVIELPEPWATAPTCGDCVFGDGKLEAQLWRLDVFKETRSLSIKPTRLPGSDMPASAFVTNIDVTLESGLAVTLFVELTLPEAADARIEFVLPAEETGRAKATKLERELAERFEERAQAKATDMMLAAFMRGTTCKDFFGRPNRADNVVVRLKQLCKNGELVYVTFEVENRRRADIHLDSFLLEGSKPGEVAGERMERSVLRFNDRALGITALRPSDVGALDRYRLTVVVAGADGETSVVIEGIEL